MTPITFDGCFGWLHPARGGRGVVLCSPHGTEELYMHRSWRDFAERLAAAGLPTLRFDYHGMGDSAGSDLDPDRVRAWLDSVHGAVARLRVETGVTEVSLVGLRLGATLAAVAAAEMGGVDALVLMAPCPTGKSFARETKALAGLTPLPDGATAPDPARGIEAGGFLLTPETVAGLNELDLAALRQRPAPRVLLLHRTDAPSSAAVARHLRQLGAAVEEESFADFAALMREVECAPTPYPALDRVRGWLTDGAPAASDIPAPSERPPVLALPEAVEHPVLFGPSGDLFGIYSTPARGDADADRPALLFVNSGATHHVGSGRNWVLIARRMAALGFSSLRMDVSGLGDSAGRPGRADNMIYCRDTLPDVLAAIDWLESRGHARCTVIGLCAGGALALNAALANPRITGQVVINPGRFFLGDGITTAELKRASLYRSPGGYLRQLARPMTWAAIVRADRRASEILRLLGLRFVRRARGMASDALARLRGREPSGPSAVPHWFRHLSRRGVDTLLVYSQGDVTIGERDLHLGPGGRKLRGVPGLTMVTLEGADHSLTLHAARERFTAILEEHLTRTPRAAGPARTMPDPSWPGGAGCGILPAQSPLLSTPHPCASPPSPPH